jgi:hypothetical protein
VLLFQSRGLRSFADSASDHFDRNLRKRLKTRWLINRWQPRREVRRFDPPGSSLRLFAEAAPGYFVGNLCKRLKELRLAVTILSSTPSFTSHSMRLSHQFDEVNDLFNEVVEAFDDVNDLFDEVVEAFDEVERPIR